MIPPATTVYVNDPPIPRRGSRGVWSALALAAPVASLSPGPRSAVERSSRSAGQQYAVHVPLSDLSRVSRRTTRRREPRGRGRGLTPSGAGDGSRTRRCRGSAPATLSAVEPGHSAQHSSLAIGTDGFAVVSYGQGPSNDLKVAHCNNLDCSDATVSLVDSAGNTGRHTSIASVSMIFRSSATSKGRAVLSSR